MKHAIVTCLLLIAISGCSDDSDSAEDAETQGDNIESIVAEMEELKKENDRLREKLAEEAKENGNKNPDRIESLISPD